jgi:hypothetical protein
VRWNIRKDDGVVESGGVICDERVGTWRSIMNTYIDW